MDGRILEIARLDFACDRCDQPAVFKVRTQYPHAQTTRLHFFCAVHIPARVVDGWIEQGGSLPR